MTEQRLILLEDGQDKPSIAALTSYLLDKVKSNAALHSALAELLAVPITGSSAGSPKHVGLVLSERLVNMPAQIMPPAYNMLQEELQWARDDVSAGRAFVKVGCKWSSV